MSHRPSELPKRIHLSFLIFQGITTIVGSGWLFGAYNAAKVAGPAAILSWILGAFAISIIAISTTLVASRFPRTGGVVHYAQYTHGSICGFILGCGILLNYITATTGEAIASTQYLSSWNFDWAHHLYNVSQNTLTSTGIAFAAFLMFVYFLINYGSFKLYQRSVIFITIVKVIIPILTIAAIISTHFHAQNFTAYSGSFMPYGWSSVFNAVTTCGIIYAYNGFQAILSFSGETHHPQRTMILAVFFALMFCLVLYSGLQIAFIGGLDPQSIAAGWHNLKMPSPFADLAIAINLNFIATILYFDAFLSPTGAGVTNLASSSRMLFGMQHYGHFPNSLGTYHEKSGVLRYGLIASCLTGLIFLFLFPDWRKMATLSSITIIVSFIAGPIAAGSLKHLLPQENFSKLAYRLSPFAFVLIAELLFWGGWPLTGDSALCILTVGCIYAVIFFLFNKEKLTFADVKSTLWLVLFVSLIAIISYLGDTTLGGLGKIPAGWDELCVALAALLCFYLAIRSAWVTSALRDVLKMENH